MTRPIACALLAVLAALAVPTVVHGQYATTREPSHWGASVSIVPKWAVPSGRGPIRQLAELMLTEADSGLTLEGNDFRIGLVRGSRLRGDWGVSFVRRSFKDGSTQGAIEQECFEQSQPPPQCFTFGTEYTYQGITLTGLEGNKFIALATIKETVQIGIDLAVGFGSMKGTALKREAVNSFTGNQTISTIEESGVPANELSALDPTILGRAEIAVAWIGPRGLKIRASGGMNMPGTQTISITGMYFFGR